ncbi:DUF6365 family protein [Mycolicibacterium sp. 624]|uniref:DUF6365 family protein n=1 Tax=Mycolicibacterium sp. 624 TaxID=3156314 RepID=UPI0033957440
MQLALIVAPHPCASGELTTALRAIDRLRAAGLSTHLLASHGHITLFGALFDACTTLTADHSSNVTEVTKLIRDLKPSLTLFADAALLDATMGSLPLHGDWIWDELASVDSSIVSLDHLGARPSSAFPDELKLLRPSPLGSPLESGTKDWAPVALERPAEGGRQRVRDHASPIGGVTILHTVSSWASNLASLTQRYLYRFYPAIIESYLGELADRVTLVSVNVGGLLPPAPEGRLSVVNVEPLSSQGFDDLIGNADLVMTENCFASTLARAICFGVPAVAWRNTLCTEEILGSLGGTSSVPLLGLALRSPQALDRWVAFPNWPPEIEDSLPVLTANPVVECFARLELFGGEATAQHFRDLVIDSVSRRRMVHRQADFMRAVALLPTVGEAIAATACRA